ncbi:SIMPL domain-containing protein [Candidatus Uhrbacteria bacterium]|nr:SIMPL domain-containing protein [Candidatus Uhrbacteria bacterium]
MWPDLRKQPLFTGLLALVLLGAFAWELASATEHARNAAAVRKPTPPIRELTVSGMGKMRGIPDMAVVTAGMTVQGGDVRTVQGEVNKKTAALIAAVKRVGVAAEDIQTEQFSINPRYVYAEKMPPSISGYEASQSITVQIRKLEQVNAVLDAMGNAGATNIANLRFTIDHPEELLAQARARAIADARAKASVIANDLRVRLVRAVGFQEGGGYAPPIMPMYARSEGMGGGDAVPMPIVEKGSQDIVVNVSVTFEIE